MPNRSISEQISLARRLCQTALARLSLSTGVASTESFLLCKDRLWGIKFSLGCYHARWQVDSEEVLLYQDNQLVGQFALGVESGRKAA